MKLLRCRSTELEILDDPNIGFEEFQETLKQLAEINRNTQAHLPSLKSFDFFLEEFGHSPRDTLKILDIGYGYGDFLRHVAAWGEERGLKLELHGIDLNLWSKRAAVAATPAELPIRYEVGDVFAQEDSGYHIIFNSLTAHHLDEATLVRLLRWMTRHARYGWVINDLHRHPVAYYFIRRYVRSKGYNRLIRNDAPLSVARAFTLSDWMRLLRLAEIPEGAVKISWHWPFRWELRYVRAQEDL